MEMKLRHALVGMILLISTSLAQAKSILIVGDSHSVGPFGRTLDQSLRAEPDTQVRLEASCGSIIRWWYTGHATPCGYLSIHSNGERISLPKAKTPLLETLINETKPDLIVVELGSNYLRGYPDETLISDVKRLLLDLKKSGSSCVWVGPPSMRKFKHELNPFIPKLEKMITPQCRWINSLPLTHYPETGGDGVHYESPGLKEIGVSWAKAVSEIISKPNPADSEFSDEDQFFH